MDSGLIFRSYRVILNQWTKWNNRSFKWLPKTSFIGRLPIRQQVCDVSQTAATLHGLHTPFLIQTWLQQHGSGAFFYSAHCSLSNPICFRSVWCWRTVIPGKIFTGLAKCEGIVSVNDFRFPFRLQELLQALLRFLRSFCFARILLGPLSSQVLHHDCISMIVSRFTSFTENFVIGCDQITKNFCTRYDSANTSSARGPCYFGPLADLAISVFREVSINTLLTQSTLLVDLGSKDSSWEELECESLCSGTLSSTRFALNSCNHSSMSEYGVPRTCSWSAFFFGVLGFRLVHVTTLLVFLKWTGLTVLVYPHFHLTRLLDGDLNDQFPDLKESWVLK